MVENHPMLSALRQVLDVDPATAAFLEGLAGSARAALDPNADALPKAGDPMRPLAMAALASRLVQVARETPNANITGLSQAPLPKPKLKPIGEAPGVAVDLNKENVFAPGNLSSP
jgi:hypothetical protein